MPNSQIHTAISLPRFTRYAFACNNNRRRALVLYRANIKLSLKMYAVIGIFEIILRNSIDRHYKKLKGESWLANAVQPGGYLDVSPGCEDTFHIVQEAIQKLGINYTHDRLIAKLTLGFWKFQFAPKEFAAAGSTLLDIFPNRPRGINQKQVYQNLAKINEMRNRIAHHEPICFDGTYISTARTQRRYKLLLEMLEWLGCDQKKILLGINGVTKAINETNSI